MSNRMTIDPFQNNHLYQPKIFDTTTNKVFSIFDLQSIIQTKVLNLISCNFSKNMTTGNSTADTVIMTCAQIAMISAVGTIFDKLRFFFNFDLYNFLRKIIGSIVRVIRRLLAAIKFFVLYKIFKFPQKVKKISKNVNIPYISDTRQINELYKAVFWYLTHDDEIDYIREPYLQYVFDKKITLENREIIKRDLTIHQILTQNKQKTINYKGHEIKYSFETEKITIYTDKDRTRENFKVILTTEIYENAQNDILEEFCQNCLSEYIDNLTSNKWVQQIYTNKDGQWNSTPSGNNRKLDTIILKNGIKDVIKEDIRLFIDSEEWYKERDIPYTRGYLFYGFPGTGKTSMIKGLSLYCKRHIHFLILSNISSDAELFELMKKIVYKDTILVIEDIDAMIDVVRSRDETKNNTDDKDDKDNKDDKDDKDNKDNKDNKKTGITLSGLLNAIDGVFSCTGRILIMTTNHPEVLDKALIRPGRIDMNFLFDNCSRDQIGDLYRMFFGKEPDINKLKNIKNAFYSPAHLTSVFLRYRNDADSALDNIDEIETKITITPLI